MSERVHVASLAAIAEIPAVGGSLRWKPVRRVLGIEAFGINAYVADAGAAVVEEHNERTDDGSGSGGHQELYLVLSGHARFFIDGEELDAPAGTLVFLPFPDVVRSAHALQDATSVLAVGADPSAPFRGSAWEYSFAAEAKAARGDYAAAAETLRGALPEHEGNSSIHYNLACYHARAGEPEQAISELQRAIQADPERVRAWAADDDDLDAIRDLDSYPA